MGPAGVSTQMEASAPVAVAVPAIAARFALHMKQHGLIYAVGWLVLDATGAWATVASQAAGVCG